MDVINSNPKYKQAYDNITTIKGVGQKSGIILLYLFLRYPNVSRQHITALAGLDPIERSSGVSVQHKERISKQGLSIVRDILFMLSMTIVRFNKEMKIFYERLLAKGKPKMVA